MEDTRNVNNENDISNEAGGSSSSASSNRSESFTFDRNLPSLHSYLGSGMRPLHHTPYWNGSETVSIPIMYIPGVMLFPGQTIPLHVTDPQYFPLMMMLLLGRQPIFGVIAKRKHDPIDEDKLVGKIGTLAEIIRGGTRNIDTVVLPGNDLRNMAQNEFLSESEEDEEGIEERIDEDVTDDEEFDFLHNYTRYEEFSENEENEGTENVNYRANIHHAGSSENTTDNSPSTNINNEDNNNNDDTHSNNNHNNINNNNNSVDIRRYHARAQQQQHQQQAQNQQNQQHPQQAQPQQAPRQQAPPPPAPVPNAYQSQDGIILVAIGRERFRIDKIANNSGTMVQANVTLIRDSPTKVPNCVRSWKHSFPPSLWQQYDPYLLMRKVKDLASIKLVSVVFSKGSQRHVSPSEYSFWLARNLPLDDDIRLKLLACPNAILRLQMEVKILQSLIYTCCGACGSQIAEITDLFNISDEGSTGVYINPHGYIHEIVTVRKVRGLEEEPIFAGRPIEANCWFPGYGWKAINCINCRNHVG
eukprot:TRINITY_DN6285_c0_g1_i2.p1 TRINITY_DN6285_c0_g1~~TRINITY_DN6285_c0_g1_i2.p1  ORF type:complete len:529 (+),score=110.04 TRINITY_DN6285_c0_g1_i2:143-1729(+)